MENCAHLLHKMKDQRSKYMKEQITNERKNERTKNKVYDNTPLVPLILRRKRVGYIPPRPPLDRYRRILRNSAPEVHPVIFKLLKFPYTHFSTITGPLRANGSHQLFTGHQQVARPLLRQMLKMLQFWRKLVLWSIFRHKTRWTHQKLNLGSRKWIFLYAA